MRFFLLGLLIINFVFAAWYWLIRQPDVIQLPGPAAGVEKLVLVSERQHATNLVKQSESALPESADEEDKPQQQPPAKKSRPLRQQKVETARLEPKKVPRKLAQQPINPSTNQYCYATTKFKSRLLADDVLADLQALGYRASVVTQYSLKPKYLVYLPSYPSLKAARKVTDHLKASGEKDFQILTINGNKNSISLGVYSQTDTAKIRMKDIETLGYIPIIAPAYGKVSGYRVEFNKPDQSLMSEQDKVELFKSYRKGSIESIKCGS